MLLSNYGLRIFRKWLSDPNITGASHFWSRFCSSRFTGAKSLGRKAGWLYCSVSHRQEWRHKVVKMKTEDLRGTWNPYHKIFLLFQGRNNKKVIRSVRLEYSVFGNCMKNSAFCGKSSFRQNRDVIPLQDVFLLDLSFVFWYFLISSE